MPVNNYNLSLQIFNDIEFFTPVKEAIVNSILADAKKVTVVLNKKNEKNDLLSDKISSIQIIDDGHGFNEDCQNSFDNIAESNKKNCKGLGRLSFIQLYDDIDIKSNFVDAEKKLQTLQFKYDENFTKINRKNYIKAATKAEKTGTVINFSKIKKEFENDPNNRCDASFCFANIIDYVLPHLCFKQCKLVVDAGGGDIKEFDLKNVKWEEWKKDDKIDINGHQFRIRYHKYEVSDDESSNNYFLYVAKDRAVKKVFSQPITSFSLPDNKKLIVVVSSDLLDSTVSADWKTFNKIPQGEWKKISSTIKKEIGGLIASLVGNWVIEQNFKEAKKGRPDLLQIINKITGQEKWVGIEGKSAIIEEARNIQSKAVSKIIKSKANEEDMEFVRESALMQLVITRWSDLSKAVEICNDEKTSEKEIHNLLYTQKTDSTSQDVNRLWLLDARWQYADYISSENEICKMFPTDDEGNVLIEEIYKNHKLAFSEGDSKLLKNKELKKRPNIAIFNDDSVVIIELIKPEVDLSYHIEKIKLYAALIAFISKEKYRNFYGYLLGSTTPKLNDTSYKQNYGGMGYSYIAELGIFEEGKTKRTDLSETIFYGEICQYNKFLKDCYFQHLEFFRKINKKIEKLEQYLPEKYREQQQPKTEDKVLCADTQQK